MCRFSWVAGEPPASDGDTWSPSNITPFLVFQQKEL